MTTRWSALEGKLFCFIVDVVVVLMAEMSKSREISLV